MIHSFLFFSLTHAGITTDFLPHYFPLLLLLTGGGGGAICLLEGRLWGQLLWSKTIRIEILFAFYSIDFNFFFFNFSVRVGFLFFFRYLSFFLSFLILFTYPPVYLWKLPLEAWKNYLFPILSLISLFTNWFLLFDITVDGPLNRKDAMDIFLDSYLYFQHYENSLYSFMFFFYIMLYIA